MSVFGRSIFDENMSLRKNAIGKYTETFVSQSPLYVSIKIHLIYLRLFSFVLFHRRSCKMYYRHRMIKSSPFR